MGAFDHSDTLFLVVRRGKFDSIYYKKLMNETIIRYIGNDTDTFIYQQDNCSVHKAKLVIEEFDSKGITLLDWPSCSPDLNPIENLWGYMGRLVYKDGKSYNTLLELENAIFEAWWLIPVEYCQGPVESMEKNVFSGSQPR